MNIKQDLIKYNLMYRAGTPIVNDQYYDDALESYKNQVSEEEYNEFRVKLFEAPGKSKHPYIMGSLEKTKADEGDDSLEKWINKNNITSLFISSKIDGLSVRLEYKDGVLIDAVTRGDGEYGESIYNKVIHFIQAQNIMDKFTNHGYNDIGFTGNIRGEIVLTETNFIKLCEIDNKEYKNARTSAVGLINSKEFNVEAIKLLSIVTYEIMGINIPKIMQYQALEKMGFETAKYTLLYSINTSTIKEELLKLFNIALERCDYAIDGLVITSTNNDTFENIKIPKNTVAFKTNLNIKETSIIDIEWNLSKSGYYIPTAVLDPVELGGAMIGRAALFNYEWVKSREIKYGAKVSVLKSGEIIPRIMSIDNSVVKDSELIFIPEVCEFCGTVLKVDSVQLVCTNKNCSEQNLLKVSQFIRRLGVDDASTKTLRNLNILSFKDLISWRPITGSKSQEKLYNEFINKIFSIKKEKLFAALDCDGMGEKTVNKLIEHYGFNSILNEFKLFWNANSDKLSYSLPDGIGEKTIESFLSTLDDNIIIYNMFIIDSRYNEPDALLTSSCTSGHLNGKSYCFTGKLNTMSRPEAEKMAQNVGGKISAVNKNLTYLVTNDKFSGSSKNKKAQELGVIIIDEEEFLNQVKGTIINIKDL